MTANRVLILGGTTEANELADILADHRDYEVITSRSGATSERKKVAGQERLGGFGGQEGLTKYLKEHDISAVIDATHPFASTITQHAHQACQDMALPFLILQRMAWAKDNTDKWVKIDNLNDAVRYLEKKKEALRVFLTTGQKELAAFSSLSQHHFLARMIEPPNLDGPKTNFEVLHERGPFSLKNELELLRGNNIDLIISKNSGGEATVAKIKAARQLAIPVLMIERPALPKSEIVTTPGKALKWLADKFN